MPTQHLGRRILVFERIDSTNSYAQTLATDPGNHGIAILAHEQSAGRGQYGRIWTAPPRSSVLLSALLFPPTNIRRPALLTAWAAVSVCEAVQQAVHAQAKIKWPNDVLLQGKKIAGILVELRATGKPETPVSAVVGIGLNVSQPAGHFVETQLPEAASLASLAGRVIETRTMAELLLMQLDAEYDRLLGGDTGTLEARWKWRLGLLGRTVTAECIKGTYQGRLLDVTLDSVELEMNHGKFIQLPPESIRQLFCTSSGST